MPCFFDLDQTLIPYDTQAMFCRHVLQRHGWRRLYLLIYIPSLLLYPVLGGDGLKRTFLAYLWGMKLSELDALAREFVDNEVLPLIYPSVLAELRKRQAEGMSTILNTASPEFYAEKIATALGFDHNYATQFDFSGTNRFPFFPRFIGTNNKREAKLARMANLNLPPAPIAGSFAYSDSEADLPMLRLAEHPIMVHPSPTLAAEGAKHGWLALFPTRPFKSRSQHLWHIFQQITGC